MPFFPGITTSRMTRSISFRRSLIESDRILSIDGFYGGVAMACEDLRNHVPHVPIIFHYEDSLGAPLDFFASRQFLSQTAHRRKGGRRRRWFP